MDEKDDAQQFVHSTKILNLFNEKSTIADVESIRNQSILLSIYFFKTFYLGTNRSANKRARSILCQWTIISLIGVLISSQCWSCFIDYFISFILISKSFLIFSRTWLVSRDQLEFSWECEDIFGCIFEFDDQQQTRGLTTAVIDGWGWIKNILAW